MTMTDDQKLRQQLDELGKLLRKRTAEFKATGGFSSIDKRFLGHVERHNARLRAKVEMAVRSGAPWEFTKTELWRDFGTLVNDVVMLEERLDADNMKKV